VDGGRSAHEAGRPLDQARRSVRDRSCRSRVKKTVAKTAEPEVTPQKLGLAVTGTIIGPSRSLARINGKTYEQGKTVSVTTKDGRTFAFQGDGHQCAARVLERLGKSYELRAESAKKSGQIDLVRSEP